MAASGSGGGAGTSNVSPGATATLTFTGTAVDGIGLRCNLCGIATVPPASPPPGTPGLASDVVFTASNLTGEVTLGDALRISP